MEINSPFPFSSTGLYIQCLRVLANLYISFTQITRKKKPLYFSACKVKWPPRGINSETRNIRPIYAIQKF